MVRVTSVMMRYRRSMSLIRRPEHSSSQAEGTQTQHQVPVGFFCFLLGVSCGERVIFEQQILVEEFLFLSQLPDQSLISV